MSDKLEKPRLVVLGVCLCLLVFLWPTVKALGTLAYNDDRYVQILAGPLISLFLIYWDRKAIFSASRYFPRIGIPVFVCAVLLCLGTTVFRTADPSTALLLSEVSLVLVWQAGFLVCYGVQSWKRAIYPMFCLALTIPVPHALMDWVSGAFQQGSAISSSAVLDCIGISALREGTTFSIPGLTFNIAPECSGIRSGVAFFLVGLLAGRLYLRSPWHRFFLIFATVPITIFKNSIRIVVTTVLAAYVDRAFIDGPFHHQYGGIIFAPVDFLLFIPLLLTLQRLEKRSAEPAPRLDVCPTPVAE